MNKEFDENNGDFYDLEYFLSLEYRYFSGAVNARLEAIFEYLNKIELKGKRVLDVGSGGGELADRMRKLGADVTGCDYSRYALKFAKERYPQLKIVRCSAYEIDKIGLHDLDLITAFDVIEHIERPELFLNKAFNLLKTDGRLVIVTDNKDYLFSKKPFNRIRNLLLRTSPSGRAYRLIKKTEAHRRQFKK